jgi:uncharacterized protein DUF222
LFVEVEGSVNSPVNSGLFGAAHHDALKAMGRSVLASGELGQHNGLPCTIIVVRLRH